MHFTEQVLKSCFHVILGYIRQLFKELYYLLLKTWNSANVKSGCLSSYLPLYQRLTKLILKTFLHIFYIYSKDKTIFYATENKKEIISCIPHKNSRKIPTHHAIHWGKTPWILYETVFSYLKGNKTFLYATL